MGKKGRKKKKKGKGGKKESHFITLHHREKKEIKMKKQD